ncbi:hypothetical protein D9756_007700 [Leucocoprinus leucothites]|uniref:Uncharacterized protein n=1 Tax=Leucocoprinus leucothites TaxID=201217 RepID=A0A8H5D3B7_9AGAR|nr:hypothetical protein D9756_007700 [Leucoagaricus leucothites]
MTATFTVPNDYHYAAAAMSLPALVVWGQVITVGMLRKRLKIPYPQLYVDKAQEEADENGRLFNCAQRKPPRSFSLSQVTILCTRRTPMHPTGLRYPLLAASVCAFWSITRIPFTLGYMTGDPVKRGRYGAKYAFGCSILLSPVAAYVAGKRLLEAAI